MLQWVKPRLSSTWEKHILSHKQGQITLWLQGQIGIGQQMKLGTSVIPHSHGIFTGQSISEIILFIQGDLQGQKVNFKVK